MNKRRTVKKMNSVDDRTASLSSNAINNDVTNGVEASVRVNASLWTDLDGYAAAFIHHVNSFTSIF